MSPEALEQSANTYGIATGNSTRYPYLPPELIEMQSYHGANVIVNRQDIVFPTNMNYGKFALDQLRRGGGKIALINGATDERITFDEIAQQVVNLASSLIELGVKRGEVVSICSENRKEYLITMIASLCAGATVTFINSDYSISDLKHIMQLSKPKYMFLSTNVYEKFYRTLEDMKLLSVYIIYTPSDLPINKNPMHMNYNELVRNNVDIDTYKAVNFNEVIETALILYSSGTTGPSKGAKITHSNLIASALQTPCFYEDHVILTLIPWCTTAGITLTMAKLLENRTLVCLWRYQEELYIQCIQKYKIGLLLSVPPLIIRLSKSHIIKKYDVSSVKIMFSGGAPLASSTIIDVKRKFPELKYVLQAYGATETTGPVTCETVNVNKLGSVGKVITGNTIKIVDIDTRKILGPNQSGEVCVKGLALFNGYIGRELKADLDDEGFYCTGDVAYYDDDGFFFIVDRLKELIKYKAGAVAPSELEALLLQHETVSDAAVIGKPDPLDGELPTAFVVIKQGAEVTEKILIDFVSSKASPWKRLRGGVIFVKEIPKNSSGKILRRKLRDLLCDIQQ